MKAKNILMSVLLAMGFIAAKAASAYPPELALVSQPVLVYDYNAIVVYYDVMNIGDYTYRGDICIFLSPDDGYCYAEKYVKVTPGRIKRVAIEIPVYRANPSWTYAIMPYYELGDELYSFTTFEYFEPLAFRWNGPRAERWVVYSVPPRVRYYTRPSDYRYYYDGYRPPMPPPHSMGYGTPPPPMNPAHHTYNYHYNNGGYPGYSSDWNNDNPSAHSNGEAPHATVKPHTEGGSMSHVIGSGSGSNSNSGNTPPPAPSNNGGSNSGRTGNSANVSRPSSSSSSATTSSSSSRSGNSGSVSRSSNSSSNSTSSGRTGNSSSVSRPSSTSSNSSSSRSGSTSSVSRSSSNTSSATTLSSNSRSGNGSSSRSSSSSNSSSSRSTSGSNSRR